MNEISQPSRTWENVDPAAIIRDSCNMSRNIRILLSLVAAAIALAATVIGVRLWAVHEQTSDWGMWPREVPSRVQFAGHDYTCGPDARVDTVDGLATQGRTAGGGDIYAQRPTLSPSVFITVRTNGGDYRCNLLGEP